MRFLKLYKEYNTQETNLIIVDVQKSFSKFFTVMYVEKLRKFAEQFTNVYQICDNHFEGKNPDPEYLYEKDPDPISKEDIYLFPNEKERIEKRYQYDVDADFYKKILDEEIYKEIKEKEKSNLLKRGDYFQTTEGTIIVYIGNQHRYFHCPKPLYDLFNKLKGQSVSICGGSQNECLLDVVTTGIALGVNLKEDLRFIYSASYCPIK